MERGTGRVYRFVFLISCIAAGITVGCAPPIGSIGGSGAGDLLWIAQNKVAYNVNEEFDRKTDLKVFTSYRGTVESIPVSQVKIGIAEDAYTPDDLVYIPLDENYLLQYAGRKLVVVEYDGMSTNYPIEVRDPYGLGGGSGSGVGNKGIGVEWDEPK